MENLTFGGYIKTIRESSGKTLRELSKELSITAGYLSDIENGRRPAPVNSRLDKFAEVLGVHDKKLFLDLAAKSKFKSKNSIPADIYEFLKKNPEYWPQIREIIKDLA